MTLQEQIKDILTDHIQLGWDGGSTEEPYQVIEGFDDAVDALIELINLKKEAGV